MGRARSIVSLMAAVLVFAGPVTAQTYKALAHFSGEEGEPVAGLIRGNDGAYYGTTLSGGRYGLGSVYRITRRGDTVAFATVHAFREAEGARVFGALVQARDGYFYGTASYGGPSGSGTVFRMSPNGRLRVLSAFDGDTTGGLPEGGLIQASDGYLYGTTLRGGAGNSGTVFRIDTAGTITVLHAFDYWSTGASSAAPLVEGHDGRLYGTTSAGGTFGQGVLFGIDKGGTLTVLHSFDERTTGSGPGPVVQGRDGVLYGTTFNGGAFGAGTLFRATIAGQVTVLRSFDPSREGGHPTARLTQGHDDALYGTTMWGGAGGAGTAFRASTGGALSILHVFEVNTTGRYPSGALLEIDDGAFYGTAVRGGPYGPGTIFRVNGGGGAQLLHAFAPGVGTLPLGGLMQASDGHFYGATRQRGGWDAGALFRLTARGSLRRLYGFDGVAGQLPSAALLESGDGWLYGTAESGGAYGLGTVFRTTRGGRVEPVHSFARADGEDPKSALVRGSDGQLYGTTCWGGPSNAGALYRMDDRGTVTVVGGFDYETGACPSAAVLQGDDDAFYGTTSHGGPRGSGTIFRFEPPGQITVVHAFSSTTGAYPLAALVKGADGFLYGTTYSGGAHDFGTVFRLEPPRTLRVLHSFDGGATGGYPAGPLFLASDGFLYGTTSAGFWGTSQSGPASGLGTIFRIDADGKVTTLHAFDGVDGAMPVAPLIEGRDGRLYSTTSLGGEYNGGVAFRLSILGVQLVTPNGGESFHPGKSTTIRWTATGRPTEFAVELSRDGGDTFGPIRECSGLEGSARSCMWKPTGPLTSKAVIRVTTSDTNGDAASDQSDSRFAIRAQPLGRHTARR